MPDSAPGHRSKSNTPSGTGCPWVGVTAGQALSPITGQQQHVSQARGSWWWSGCFCSAPACPRTLPPLAEALALKRSCQKDVLNGQL